MADNNIDVNNNMTGGEEGNNQNVPATNTPATSGEEGTPSALGGNPGEGGNQPIVYDFSKAFDEGAELDEAVTKEFSELLNGVGATQEQAVQLAQFGSKYAQNIVAAYQKSQEDAMVAQYQKDYETAKTELGTKYDETVAQAGKGIEVIAKSIPNIRDVLKEARVDNNINFIKLFAAIGQMGGEDTGVGGNKSTGNAGGASVMTEEQLAEAMFPSMKK